MNLEMVVGDIEFSRRKMLGALGVAGLASAGLLRGVPASAETSDSQPWNGELSANEWPILDSCDTVDVEGSGQMVALAAGLPASILTAVARMFHYEVDELRAGDLTGHATSRHIGQVYESNYLSGTAIAIRPYAYPVQVSGGFHPWELVIIRDIIAEFEGVVAWGGDFAIPKESHFEIAVPPSSRQLARVGSRLAGWETAAGGQGPGSIDAFSPSRRARAERFLDESSDSDFMAGCRHGG